jgi:hypothetical protein
MYMAALAEQVTDDGEIAHPLLTMRFDGQPVATQWQRIRLDLAVFEPRRFATASAC